MLSNLTKDITESHISAHFDRLCSQYHFAPPSSIKLIKPLNVAYVVFANVDICSCVFEVSFLLLLLARRSN